MSINYIKISEHIRHFIQNNSIPMFKKIKRIIAIIKKTFCSHPNNKRKVKLNTHRKDNGRLMSTIIETCPDCGFKVTKEVSTKNIQDDILNSVHN